MMEIVLFILLFLATFKALLYKMSMLAILEYYVEQGASIPEKEQVQEYQTRGLKKWLHIKSPSNL